ncbi:2-dehydro-3-deoxygluconokinase [Microbacterium terrae]|uniref:2-dehydro-3-deoxygluconokinase n=1 Tax=Microbacterium terrae TaxID=69369 RepID=A0A0M2HD08_9MICO|nr:sugar kinase [Microbacterium terrae]KJL44506.1 2-dehydro-3-deoxygluconokinase [Microbacterium terrae]MBP1079491.1 2-dehydro-3-deoxygluconokinase [Microbacterium terrae]GLJ96832.1 carbohydrate kinase [Microbacterium terrae]
MTNAELLTVGETMALVTGDLAEGTALALSSGGAESNVAIGAAMLGVRSAWVSRVGDDPFGAMVRDAVASRGVDVGGVRTDPARRTGLMVKQPSPTGSRVFYYRAGSAASALSPADLDGAPAARVLHTTGITPALSASAHALVEHILDTAAVASFDVNYRPVLWESKDTAATVLLRLARRAHIVFVGRDEAENLWGTSTAESVRDLLPDVPHLVVKDGDIEAVEFHGQDVTRVPAKRVEVVEPVGAGDAFAAGWLTGYLRDQSPAERVAAGHTSAVAVLMSPHDTAAPAAASTITTPEETHP